MPGFDGTGPRGEGPMTGRGEGYCSLVLPSRAGGEVSYGYAGLQGTPVYLKHFWRRLTGWTRVVGLRRRRGTDLGR
jgi:hypothetical protein